MSIDIRPGTSAGFEVVRIDGEPAVQLYQESGQPDEVTIFWRAYTDLEQLRRFLNNTLDQYDAISILFDFERYEIHLPPKSHVPDLEDHLLQAYAPSYGWPEFVRYDAFSSATGHIVQNCHFALWAELATYDEIRGRCDNSGDQPVRREAGVWLNLNFFDLDKVLAPAHDLLDETIVPAFSRVDLGEALQAIGSRLRR